MGQLSKIRIENTLLFKTQKKNTLLLCFNMDFRKVTPESIQFFYFMGYLLLLGSLLQRREVGHVPDIHFPLVDRAASSWRSILLVESVSTQSHRPVLGR